MEKHNSIVERTYCGGCVVNILINLQTGIDTAVVLGGMISGLASTGLYEMMRNLLEFYIEWGWC